MLSVQITGISGFVGQNLQKYLKASHQIVPLKVRYIPQQVITIQSDVLIHLAGKAHDIKKISTANDYYEANFELTKQLYDAFLLSDAKIFIFISSVKAVADVVHGVLDEQAIPNPITHYGKSKLMAEQYIQAQPLPKGKKFYILRPCMIHGEGNKGNLNLLYKLVKKGIPWFLGAFENKRSFLSIENLCFVIKQLIENEAIETGIYHLADDEAISTNDLIRLIATSLHRKTYILYFPVKLITFIAKIGDVLKLPLNTERLSKLTENYIVSNAKIKLALCRKMPVTTTEGLLKTLKSFK